MEYLYTTDEFKGAFTYGLTRIRGTMNLKFNMADLLSTRYYYIPL